jgi:hypothetical protein
VEERLEDVDNMAEIMVFDKLVVSCPACQQEDYKFIWRTDVSD